MTGLGCAIEYAVCCGFCAADGKPVSHRPRRNPPAVTSAPIFLRVYGGFFAPLYPRRLMAGAKAPWDFIRRREKNIYKWKIFCYNTKDAKCLLCPNRER